MDSACSSRTLQEQFEEMKKLQEIILENTEQMRQLRRAHAHTTSVVKELGGESKELKLITQTLSKLTGLDAENVLTGLFFGRQTLTSSTQPACAHEGLYYIMV